MINKILVRAPETLDKIVHSFPFLYKLKEKYPDSQINIIVNEGMGDFYKLLPFKFHLYELPDIKNTFLGSHHFSANQNDIFNIDVYFDLVGDKKSGFMGLSFRAKKRVGYINGINKFFLTDRYDVQTGVYADRFYMTLLENFENEKFSDYILGSDFSLDKEEGEDDESNVISFTKIKEEKELSENPFDQPKGNNKVFLVSLDTLKENESQIVLWKELFNLFDNQVFIFWNFWSDSTMEDFVAELGDKNKYLIQSGGDFSKYNNLLNECSALITNQVWLSYISIIKETIPFLFTKRPKDLVSFGHVIGHKHVIEMDDESMIKIISGKGDDKDLRVTDEVVDFIHDSLKL